jgi:hypothetical protein
VGGSVFLDDVITEDSPTTGISHAVNPLVTVMTKVVWGFPTQSLLCVGRHVKCPLFWSDRNQNWNVSTKLVEFSVSDLMKISLAVFEFLHADRPVEANRHVFATFSCERAQNILQLIAISLHEMK